ncbi:hypothetical protein LRP52_49800 [Photobacterium sp. ZSDE20]|uniref:Uncharacterized protein n=1 Tax=Photobacterium pectinilyticum TaxID=2906793 RepID=A0ABT1N9I9_9GAMM|nr:hypothetical protein [Photobacterium sp. ZSDE20]MCQ1061420.1 hypothetical protein [Photobacterium sp. ZSDE20]MDD1830222.1 hypothetical protein [Photobacterium sp. ZSDE20]
MVAIPEVGLMKFSEDLLKESKEVKLRPWHFIGNNPLSKLARKIKELDKFIDMSSELKVAGGDRDILIARENLMSLKLNLAELYYKLGLMLMSVFLVVLAIVVLFLI